MDKNLKGRIIADLIDSVRSEILNYLFAAVFTLIAIILICEFSRYFGMLFIAVAFFLLGGIYSTAEYYDIKKALDRLNKEEGKDGLDREIKEQE